MKTKILVVDDEKDNVDLIRKLLKYEGYEVIEAYDGEKGLAFVYTERPDLILLDIMMPKKNGLDVCKELKSDPKTVHIPILMLTSKRDVTSMIEGLDIGADDYVTKPVNFRELLARIRTHLRISERSEQLCKLRDEEDTVQKALDLIFEAQHRSCSVFTNAMAEEIMMFELGSIDEFNRFSAEVKKLENVGIKDVKVFENKYIIRLSIFPPAFHKIV